jgi:hypothetical protein
MACAVCHLVNGKGGKLGPDLSTVGSYMTPESIDLAIGIAEMASNSPSLFLAHRLFLLLIFIAQ